MDAKLLFCAALRVVREEGMPALAVRAWHFVRDVLNRVISLKRVYVYRFDLGDWESFPSPGIPPGFEIRFVTSNGDADSLADRGYEDLRDRFLRARDSLSTGAVALCAFRGKSLVHVGWVACSTREKRRFDVVPYAVNFARGEACLGSVFTFPEYRGQGLAPHSMRLRLEYLRAKGCVTTFAAVEAGNVASVRAMTRVGTFTRRTAHHLKLPGINWIRYAGEVEPVPRLSVTATKAATCSGDGDE